MKVKNLLKHKNEKEGVDVRIHNIVLKVID